MGRKQISVMAAVFVGAFAISSFAHAQNSAPKVRLTSTPIASFDHVKASVSLNEDAYILAVAIDRDGRISVLSPELPGDIMKFEASKSIRLPDFFSGFGMANNAYRGRYGSEFYHTTFASDYATSSSNGSVIVIASRTPLNFSSISDGLYWNEDALARLVRYRIPASAVSALGRAVTAKGQSFGHDYLSFGSNRYSSYAGASRCFSGLSPRYGMGGFSAFASYPGFLYGAYVLLAAKPGVPGLKYVYTGTDECGRPQYIVMPYMVLPEREKADTVKTATPTIRSADAGTYTGEDARRLLERLQRENRSESYSFVARPRVNSGEETSTAPSRPVLREAAPKSETFERVRSFDNRPIERAGPVSQSQPVQRAPDPVSRPEPRVISTPAPQTSSQSTPAVVIKN